MSEHDPTPTAVESTAPAERDTIAAPVGIDMTTPHRGQAVAPEVAVQAEAPADAERRPTDAEHTGAEAPSAETQTTSVHTPDSAIDQAPVGEAAPETDHASPPGEAELDPGPPTLPKLDRLPRPQEPRLIALINQKGGVGKTTTTVNLGAALAASGLRVLMIDLDPQAHLTLSVGIDPESLDASIYDLLTDASVSASEVVRMVEGCPNLGVLPAETNLAGVESEMAEMVATGLAQTVLRNKTADLIQQFDYVLLDCPPSLGLLTINGLTAAKEIIVPMQAHFLALQGMGKLFETINMIRQGINPSLTVAGVVLCMHEANTILASDVVADVQGFFEQARGTALPWANAEVYQPPIRRNIKLAEAPSFGQSVLTYAGDSNGAKDYAKLARSVAQAAV